MSDSSPTISSSPTYYSSHYTYPSNYSENSINSTPNSKEYYYSNVSSNKSPSYSNYGSSSPSYSGNESNSRSYRSEVTNNEEIKAFLSSFNNRFNVEAYSLHDVLDIVTEITKKSVQKQKKEKEITKDSYPKENNQQILQEISSLTIDNANLKNRITELEHENNELKTSLSSTLTQIETLQKQNESFKGSISSMQELYETQLQDNISLSNQRSKLIDIVQKQTAIINKLNQVANSNHAQLLAAKRNENSSQQSDSKHSIDCYSQRNDAEEQMYSCLVTIVKLLEDNQIENIKEFQNIKDNPELSVRERIIMIVKCLFNISYDLKGRNYDLQTKNNELKDYAENVRDKCIKILSLFEEELRFLQKLTHSSDLQNVVFYQEKTGTVLRLSEENKADLIRKCAVLGSFVEDTIGEISSEQFYDVMSFPETIDAPRIFELLHFGNMEKIMKEALLLVNSPDELDTRQLFDMLCAQIYINYLLKNYSKELGIAAARRKRQIDCLQQQGNKENLEKENSTLKKREQKIRAFLLQFIDADKKTPTFKILKLVFYDLQKELMKYSQNKKIKQGNGEEQQSMESSSQSENGNSQKNQKYSSTSSNGSLETRIDHLIEELDKAKQELKESQDLNEKEKEENEKLKKDIESLQSSIKEKENEISNNNKNKENYEKEINQLKENLEQNESKCNELAKILSDNEQTIITFKKQRRSISKKLAQFEHCNEMLRQENVQAKEDAQKQILEFSQKHQTQIDELQSRLQAIINESENKAKHMEEIETENQKLNATITNLTIEKKTLEMKLKAEEQKNAIQTKPQIPEELTKFTALQNERDEAFSKLCKLNSTDKTPSTLLEAVECVEQSYSQMKQTQISFAPILDEMQEARSILGVLPNETLIENIKKLVEEFSKVKGIKVPQQQQQDDIQLINAQKEIEQIRNDLKNAQNKLISLKKWENWARRIYSVVFDIENVNISNEDIRMALDEALLSSVSHRSIFMKIQSLRSQKQLFLQFDRPLLSAHCSKQSTSFRATIISIIAARKMMKYAGCLPLAMNVPSMKKSSENDVFVSNRNLNHKRRSSKERKAHRGPVIPVFI